MMLKTRMLLAVLLFLYIPLATDNVYANDQPKQLMTCFEAASRIYAELSDSDKLALAKIRTTEEFRANQRSKQRIILSSPYYRHPGVNKSCAEVYAKEYFHFEILPLILTEWVWHLVLKHDE